MLVLLNCLICLKFKVTQIEILDEGQSYLFSHEYWITTEHVKKLPKKNIANVILGQKVYTLMHALKNDLKIML